MAANLDRGLRDAQLNMKSSLTLIANLPSLNGFLVGILGFKVLDPCRSVRGVLMNRGLTTVANPPDCTPKPK